MSRSYKINRDKRNVSKTENYMREKVNWTLTGKGFTEKDYRQVLIKLAGNHKLFDPKDVKWHLQQKFQHEMKYFNFKNVSILVIILLLSYVFIGYFNY